MGKLNSKHACKRRENPEGDSFVAGASASRRGEEDSEGRRVRDKQDLSKQLRDGGQFAGHDCPLEVALRPEKGERSDSYPPYLHSDDGGRHPPRDLSKCSVKKGTNLDETEYDAVLEDDSRQEWVFTLYDFDNSGRVTKEDMSSLMHTIYDVVDASLSHPPSSHCKTLRVKLTVTPSPGVRRREPCSTGTDGDVGRCRAEDHLDSGRCSDRRHSAFFRGHSVDSPVSPEGKHYCVDENTERRNHYLDLAGIENYTSRFEGETPHPQTQQEQHGQPLILPPSAARTS